MVHVPQRGDQHTQELLRLTARIISMKACSFVPVEDYWLPGLFACCILHVSSSQAPAQQSESFKGGIYM